MFKLLIGSMGTLGIISELIFNLRPLPEKEESLFVPFETLNEACGFIHEILHSQLLPVSIEILNASAVKRMTVPVLTASGGNYLVAIGLEGVRESIERQTAEMSKIGRKYGALDTLSLNSDRNRPFWVSLRDV